MLRRTMESGIWREAPSFPSETKKQYLDKTGQVRPEKAEDLKKRIESLNTSDAERQKLTARLEAMRQPKKSPPPAPTKNSIPLPESSQTKAILANRAGQIEDSTQYSEVSEPAERRAVSKPVQSKEDKFGSVKPYQKVVKELRGKDIKFRSTKPIKETMSEYKKFDTMLESEKSFNKIVENPRARQYKGPRPEKFSDREKI